MLLTTAVLVFTSLTRSLLRCDRLADRSYDKRKNAALELTAFVRTLQVSLLLPFPLPQNTFFSLSSPIPLCLPLSSLIPKENNEKDRIVDVINVLAQEFVRSRNSNHRKGGLIGVAACAIGFMQDVQRYLHLLLPPVLECFDDQESRVCYYACEALYNIAKVSRNSILRYFNQIFDGLCKLFAHVDVDVKNGANLLDRLIKDIVTESETFDMETFIPLLQKHIKRTKPYIRQLLVGWISILNSVPDISMLDYLPEFLDGLFNMLSDGNREIRQGAGDVLSDFLQEIKETEVVEFGPMVLILVNFSHSHSLLHSLTL